MNVTINGESKHLPAGHIAKKLYATASSPMEGRIEQASKPAVEGAQ